MSTTNTTTTIAATRGIDCDATELLRLLTLTGIRAETGLRDIVNTGDGIQGRVGIRGGHKLLIRLNVRDLFDVEIGHPTRRLEWIVDRQSFDVGADQLAATVRTLAEGVLR